MADREGVDVYKGKSWPDDAALFELFVQLGHSRKAVAQHLGRHPETLRAYLRRHRPELNERMQAATPEGKPAAQRSREYRERHPDRRRAQSKVHYLANRDALLAQNAEWHRANRERVRDRKRRELETDRDRVNRVRRERHARDGAATRQAVQLRYHARNGGPDAAAYAEVLLSDPCGYCGAPMKDIDHIVPLSKGGTGEWDNLTAACASCNRSKQAKSVLEFMLSRLDEALRDAS